MKSDKNLSLSEGYILYPRSTWRHPCRLTIARPSMIQKVQNKWIIQITCMNNQAVWLYHLSSRIFIELRLIILFSDISKTLLIYQKRYWSECNKYFKWSFRVFWSLSFWLEKNSVPEWIFISILKNHRYLVRGYFSYKNISFKIILLQFYWVISDWNFIYNTLKKKE